MTKTLATIALLLALSACTEKPGEPQETVDPYQTYLSNNPAGQPVLSREDAQARAYLGCGLTLAPGTIDAVLRDAYNPTC